MFVIWLYVSWMIVLVGIQVAFYVQNPELVRHGLRRNEIGGRTFERVALHIMYLIGRAYEESAKPWSREQLARRLHLPTDIILDVLDRLQQRSLIMRISSRRNIARYAPARDMGKITLRDIVMAVRQNPKSGQDADKHLKSVPQVEALMGTMDRAMDNVLGTTTLKQFVEEGDPAELHTKTVMRARHT
jgi:membrane protein